MIKKNLESKLDWPNQLKFALFACRSAQNRNTGYSLFEIVYGRQVRGPLELLKEEWESPKKKVMNVCDWVDRLRKRLEIVHEVVNEREKDAKVKMKSMYDKRATHSTWLFERCWVHS